MGLQGPCIQVLAYKNKAVSTDSEEGSNSSQVINAAVYTVTLENCICY